MALGQMIRAIIGKDKYIQNIAERLVYAIKHDLPQGFALIYLTDCLFDDIEELINEKDTCKYSSLNYLSDSVIVFLEEFSRNTQLIYIETDYFGGYGTQAGVLFENGFMKEPMSGEGTINFLLRSIGVHQMNNKDEFDSLQLYKFRRME